LARAWGRAEGKVVFLDTVACSRRRRASGVTLVAGETSERRVHEGRFRVASFGAAGANLGTAETTFLVVSRRRFHIGGAGPRVEGGAAADAAGESRGGGAPAR
jgi:hypothetical protein